MGEKVWGCLIGKEKLLPLCPAPCRVPKEGTLHWEQPR